MQRQVQQTRSARASSSAAAREDPRIINHNQDGAAEEEASVDPEGAEDDENVTVIELANDRVDGQRDRQLRFVLSNGHWIDLVSPPLASLNSSLDEERRTLDVAQQLEKVQKKTFCHFTLMCLVPTSLLLFVVVDAFQRRGLDCSGQSPHCENDPRSFLHAYTTQCICDAVAAD